MPPCRRCWRTWAGEPLRPGCSPQLELDKPSQINYTMNRKSADRNMASSTFPFKSKRLTAEFVRLGAVNLFCFYRSSREKFSSQHQMPLSQLRRAGSKEQLLPSVPRKLLSESSDIPLADRRSGKRSNSKKFRSHPPGFLPENRHSGARS